MALIICGDCKKKYSDFAKECPECARPTISQENAKEKLEVLEDKKYKSNISRFMKSFIEKKFICINKLKVVENDELRRSFLKEFRTLPRLTSKEELSLAKQVQEYMQIDRAEIELIKLKGDKPNIDDLSIQLDLTELQIKKRLQTGERAMIKMLRANLKFVALVAWGYTDKNKKIKFEFNELLKEGLIGLVKAIETFESIGEYSFTTYAHHHIKVGIEDLLVKKVRFIYKCNFEIGSNSPDENLEKNTFHFEFNYFREFCKYECLVLGLIYGLDGGKPLSRLAIGQVLGISDLAVKKIEKEGFYKLKKAFLRNEIHHRQKI